MTRPVVGTVIVLNYEGADWLDGCLSSLAEQTRRDFDVLVVDNASTDGSARIAERRGVGLLKLPKNVGFSAGNNAGARVATGNWLVFVNNDMRFAPTFVEEITRPLSDPSIFAVDIAHTDWEGRPSHRATGVAVRRRMGGLLRTIEYPERTASEMVDVPFACGGAIAVNRGHFDAIGGFDERFFAGSEDVDLCWRGWLRGWRTTHLPEALCEHLIGGASTTPAGRRLRGRAVVKGQLVMATKHFPLREMLSAWVLTAPRALLRPRLWAALGHSIVDLPGLLRDRSAIHFGTHSASEHLARMTALGDRADSDGLSTEP